MYKKGANGNRNHEANSEPAECAVRHYPFGRDELNKPERKGRDGGEGMNLNRRGGCEQWGERHGHAGFMSYHRQC